MIFVANRRISFLKTKPKKNKKNNKNKTNKDRYTKPIILNFYCIVGGPHQI